MIWEWEILSGHYPSVHQREFFQAKAANYLAPENIPLASTILNPAVPALLLPPPSSSSPLVAYHQRTTTVASRQLIGVGPDRRYISLWDHTDSSPGFPSRPSPGSVLDLDLVLEKCDLSTNKVSSQS